MLANLLDAHSEIRCQGEILNPRYANNISNCDLYVCINLLANLIRACVHDHESVDGRYSSLSLHPLVDPSYVATDMKSTAI